MICLVSIVFLFDYQLNSYLSEDTAAYYLKNNSFEISISKTTGDITSVVFNNGKILSQNGKVNIGAQLNTDTLTIITKRGEDHFPKFAEVYFMKKYSRGSVEQRLIIDNFALYWEIEVLGKVNIEEETAIDFNIPIIRSINLLLHPYTDASLDKYVTARKYIYRHNLFLPIITAYNPNENYGLSIIAPLEIAKPGLSFVIDKENLVISFHHLRLTKKRKTKVAIYLIPHTGDWRAGLNFLLKKYPDYFYPKVENTKIGEGWYFLSGPFDKEDKVIKTKNKDVKWIESHGYFPFYGLYAPRDKDWGLLMDSDSTNLSDWESVPGPIRNSYTNENDLVNLWHKHKIRVYLYFQSFEAWHQYAERYFAGDIARDKNGNPLPAWKFCDLMNPDPSGKWGKYIISQADDLIKRYPSIDGIFYDRMDYWNYDFAHDDGITMTDGKPAYMLGFAQEKINEKIFEIFHKENKGIWGNGPTSIEVCKNLDGIMAEGSLRNLYKLQYLALARPFIYLPYDRQPKETEEKLKNALVCGAFPSITYGGTECQRLDEKYQPVFELITNRRWVLSSNPIAVPDEYSANIFQTPDSNYVIAIISPDKSQLVPHPFDYNIPIKINVPDASSIKFAYLLSGDYRGVNSIDFEKSNGSLRINLPYHLTSSLILLARNKKYDLVRLSSPILIKGRKTDLVFRVEQFDSNRPSIFEIEAPWFKASKVLKSNRIEFNTIIPSNINGETEIKIRYNGKEYMMSCWVVDPISMLPKEDIFVQSHEDEDIPFWITNNLDKTIIVGLDAKFASDRGKVYAPKEILLKPFESKEFSISFDTKTESDVEIELTMNKRKIRRLFPIKVSFAHEKDDLFYDNFQNGMKNWTINRGKWDASNEIANGSGSSYFAYVKNNEWRDYVYEVKTRCKGSGDPSVDWLKSYLFFRLQDEKNFYRFGIHGDAGVVDLYKSVNGKWIELGASLFSPEPDKWYALRIQAKGVKIIGYLNGEKVVEVDDNTFLSGGIGIGVLEDNMICDYRDVIVKRL